MDWLNRCHFGDCIETMRRMPDGIVQTCVTSPPYFGLRDYGHAGQIGLEETPAEFVAKLVEVFREVRRLLREDGTLWLNLGDSYAGSWGAQGRSGGNADGKHSYNKSISAGQIGAHPHKTHHTGSIKAAGVKPKDLYGIPWRVAFALQEDGWYLRQDIIWHKPNPIPESIKDRCTKAHEYVFLLSKAERYYYDQGAILEPVSANTHARLSQNVAAQPGSERANGGAKTNGAMKAVGRRNVPPGQPLDGDSDAEALATVATERNKRSVWTVPTKGYSGAHFAVFPPALIEPCVLAGAPAGGVVLDPFFGSGTTGHVAQNLGRAFIGCELNPAYEQLQADRLRQPSLLLEAA